MIRKLEEQKEALKKKMSEAIDEYCDKFNEGSEREKFTINDIEALMLENRRKINVLMEEANSEFVSEIEAEIKKNAPSAEGI